MPGENVNHVARRHRQTIASLPEPPNTFEFCDVEMSHGELLRFVEHGLIAKETDEKPHEWRVKERVYDYVTTREEESDGFSCCGGMGVKNVDGSLRCKSCGTEVSRDEFRRVM